MGNQNFFYFFQLFSCILPKNTKFCMSCNYMSLNVKEVIVYFVIITILTNQATPIHWRTSYTYINKSIFKTPTIYTSLATITNYFNVFHVTDDVNNVDLFSFYLWFSEKCQNQKIKKKNILKCIHMKLSFITGKKSQYKLSSTSCLKEIWLKDFIFIDNLLYIFIGYLN